MTSKSKASDWPYYLLVAIGLVQTIGFLAGVKEIRGIGIATMASPLPIVFTQFRGIETFALEMTSEITTNSGEVSTHKMTPEKYSMLKGPYNLRNVYGAVISYGAGFESAKEKKLLHAVLNHGFCQPGNLSRDMELPTDISDIKVHLKPKTKDDTRSWTLEHRCVYE